MNPLAIEWTEKWLKHSDSIKKRKRQSNKKISDNFDMTMNGINMYLKNLAKKAGIKTTGPLKFHRIRGWVMSGLSRCGFNEFQVKTVLGKTIPMTDATYLHSLEQEIRERYPKAYENYLNLSTSVSKDLKKKTDKLEKKNTHLQVLVNSLAIENQRMKDKFSKLENENGETKKEMHNLSLSLKSIAEKLEKLKLKEE